MSSNAHPNETRDSNESQNDQRRRRRRGRNRQRPVSDEPREQQGQEPSVAARDTQPSPAENPQGTNGREQSDRGREQSDRGREQSDRGRRNRRGRGQRKEGADGKPENPENEQQQETASEPPRKARQQEPPAQQQERGEKKRDRNKKKREKPDVASQPGSLQRRMVRIDGPREELHQEPYIPVIEPVKASNVDEYIASHKGWQRDVMAKLRTLVTATCPEAVESIKWSQPVYEYEGFLCYMKAFSNHVNLGFWRGSELSDPEGLLTGDGLKLRHVKLTSANDFNAPAFAELIKHAMRLNREKGDPTLS